MKKRINGYVTVYVSLCMCVLMALCLVLIEGARRSTIRLEGEMVADVAMESILAEYHRGLFEQYNLFYIDSSYGSGEPSYGRIRQRLQHYLDKNTRYHEELMLDFLYKDFLQMEFQQVQIEKAVLATDENGYGFARQAIEAVKDDIGISYLEAVLDFVREVEEKGLLEGDLSAQKKEVEKQLQLYSDKMVSISEKEWTTFDVVSPTKIVDNIQAKGILWWVIPKDTAISAQKIDASQYISARRGTSTLNQGNGERQEKLDVMERLFFQEYLLRYTGRYGAEKEEGLLSYQTEYLIEGQSSDEHNLSSVAWKICGIRQLANMAYLLSDAEKVNLVKGVSTLLAAAILLPEAAPIIEGAVILAWAYLESVYDTEALFLGGKVPLLKNADTWHYSLNNIWDGAERGQAQGFAEGIVYEDYMRVFLFLQNQETLIARFMDVVEMDIRLLEGNESFRLDGCVECVGMKSKIHSAYGYDFEIQRERAY